MVNNYKGLVEYYRSKGLKLWVYVDPQNGLDRASDARELVAAGKSIADADMQNIYRRFVVVMDSVLSPEHLGLALETNLIRAAASPAIYERRETSGDISCGGYQVREHERKVERKRSSRTGLGKIHRQRFPGYCSGFC